MKCPHCLTAFHVRWIDKVIENDIEGQWTCSHAICPECGKLIVYLLSVQLNKQGNPLSLTQKQFLVRPKGASRPPCPVEVDHAGIKEDYEEACLVLSDSPKASAALSRRCLQHILREKAGVKKGNLNNEIQQVLDSNALPSDIADQLNNVREIGAFSAHPIKSESTGEIVPIERGEAEWDLDTIEDLLDFCSEDNPLLGVWRH